MSLSLAIVFPLIFKTMVSVKSAALRSILGTLVVSVTLLSSSQAQSFRDIGMREQEERLLAARIHMQELLGLPGLLSNCEVIISDIGGTASTAPDPDNPGECIVRVSPKNASALIGSENWFAQVEVLAVILFHEGLHGQGFGMSTGWDCTCSHCEHVQIYWYSMQKACERAEENRDDCDVFGDPDSCAAADALCKYYKDRQKKLQLMERYRKKYIGGVLCWCLENPSICPPLQSYGFPPLPPKDPDPEDPDAPWVGMDCPACQ